MKVTKKIEQELQQIPEGRLFRYEDLPIEPSEYEAAAKAMGRYVSTGTLKRVSKGVFYKPEQTIFGLMPPSDEDIIRQYIFKNGYRTAYITGTGLYNRMGLTTQVPFVYVLATKTRRSEIMIGKVKIKPVRSYVDVDNENYKLLGILDALKDFKIIQDINRISAIIVLKSQLRALSSEDLNNMIRYSINYPPRTRALLGALLEDMNSPQDLSLLKKTLSPASQFRMGITPKILSNATKWHLK